MTEEVNKYIYRKVAIENSYIVEELPDGSKKIIFQPIIYINCRNQKDLTIIDFDLTESITDHVSAPAVNNSNNNLSESLVPAESSLLNNGTDIITKNLPGIIKDINQRDLVKSATDTANHLKKLKTQTVNQDVLEPIVEIPETNFDDSTLNMLKPQRDLIQTRSCKSFNNSIQTYCSKCQRVSTSMMGDKCSNCLYFLQFQCMKCFQLFESQAMVENHAMQCEIKTKSFLENFSCKLSRCNNNPTVKLLRRHIEKCSPSKTKKKSFECKQCKSLFQDNCSLLRHHVVCEKQGITQGQCPYCPFSSAKKGILSHHISKKHQEYMPDDFKCSRCERKYNKFSSLQSHMKKSRCTKKTLYTCNHCNLQTYNKMTLADHLKKNHAYSLKQRVSAKMKMYDKENFIHWINLRRVECIKRHNQRFSKTSILTVFTLVIL